jgi:hypothetical protein
MELGERGKGERMIQLQQHSKTTSVKVKDIKICIESC